MNTIPPAVSALQSELINLTQKSGQSVCEFSDEISEKLKELYYNIICMLYVEKLVVKGFFKEYEKIATRAMKVGLTQTLQSRVVNFQLDKLDELAQKGSRKGNFC